MAIWFLGALYANDLPETCIASSSLMNLTEGFPCRLDQFFNCPRASKYILLSTRPRCCCHKQQTLIICDRLPCWGLNFRLLPPQYHSPQTSPLNLWVWWRFSGLSFVNKNDSTAAPRLASTWTADTAFSNAPAKNLWDSALSPLISNSWGFNF